MKPEVEVRRRASGPSPSATLAMLRVAVPVWTLFGLLCAASALWGMRTHGHSPVRVATYEVLVWCGWAAVTPVVAWLGQRRSLLPFSWSATATHVGAALALGLLHHVWWTALVVLIHPFDAMGVQDLWTGLGTGVRDRLFLEVTVYFAILGVTYAIDYQRRLRDRELRAAQLEASLTQARLASLELQLRPHFLFNTLHAIGGLVRQGRGPEAVEMIAGLSDLLRYSLDHADRHLVALDQELAITARYLDIQRQRFSDRLAVTVDVPAELHAVQVPAMLLQPLVENAVRHGIERSSEPGRIDLRARRDGDDLVIDVCNSGPPLGTVEPGIGIANTRARLAQLYPGRHAFALRSDAGGVIATVTLPCGEAR